MELYILSKQDLSILSICKLSEYQINLDEETNAKSTFTLMKTEGLKKDNFMVLNGLYRQFLFIIDDVQTEKSSDMVVVTALDISNIFDRKVIEKNTSSMTSNSIEEFIANTMAENFINSDDKALNVGYIDVYWKTNTKTAVPTNAENGLYNFHTFLTNCRQYKNIYTDFKLENIGKPQTMRGKQINIEAKNRQIVDITLEGESIQEGTPDAPISIGNIKGNIEFKSTGKNFCNLYRLYNAGYSVTINGITYTVNDDGSVTANGTATANSSFYVYNNANPLHLLPETYRLSGENSAYSNTAIRGFYYTSDGTQKYVQSTTAFTITEEVDLRIYIVILSGQTVSNLKFYPMLEAGEKATEYEKYKEQTATFPLGEEKLYEGSYLADDGKHHIREQVIYDGSDDEVWKKVGSRFYITNSKIIIESSNSEVTVMCDKLKGVSYGYLYTNNGTDYLISNCGTSGGSNRIFISTNIEETGIETVEDLKIWLASNPITVEYDLAEEEIVPYTEEQQEAWNTIKAMQLYEGVNNINCDANIDLTYYPLIAVGMNFILRIDIENKKETAELIDTTLPEVTDYNKIYEEDVTAKVQVYIREDGSEYNLYLKTDRTTTTDKDDPDRVSGKIEVISVDTSDLAAEEALNVMKGNNYKHLVEFKIAKTSELMDITKLHIGRPIRIKTDDDIYDSYISAITLSDENFVYFKSGSLRITLLDKLKKTSNNAGNKLDVTGGKIVGNLNVEGIFQVNGKDIHSNNMMSAVLSSNVSFEAGTNNNQIVLSKDVVSGDGLSLSSDGGIKIGKGISHVLVSAGLKIQNNNETSSSAYNLYIYKNNSIVGSSRTSNVGVGYTDGLSLSNILVEVEEGDIIYLKFWKTSNHLATVSSSYKGTFLSVVAV